MRCQANGCYAVVNSTTSDYCKMHSSEGTFAFSYHEWDRDRWDDRVDLLLQMWKSDALQEQRKRVIADLIIHSHDIVENSPDRKV